jgi:hypothetical protein
MGQCVATPVALEALQAAGVSPLDLLSRHVQGDWGDLSQDDLEGNNQALVDGSRLLSPTCFQARIRKSGLSQKQWVMMARGPAHVF